MTKSSYLSEKIGRDESPLTVLRGVRPESWAALDDRGSEPDQTMGSVYALALRACVVPTRGGSQRNGFLAVGNNFRGISAPPDEAPSTPFGPGSHGWEIGRLGNRLSVRILAGSTTA